MKHTKKDADYLLQLMKIFITKKAVLIGSFGKGAEMSNHDIDILLPNFKKTKRLKEKLTILLLAKEIEDTDWGGWYFKNTFFGDVDVFFNTKEFDY